MNRPLADAWAKLKRANAHADTLHREIRAIKDSKIARVAHGPDPETSDYIFRLELLEEPPLQELGLTTGDILHNLHSALDSLAWQLVSLTDGEPDDKLARVIHFPLAATPQSFRSRPILKHISDTHRAMLNDVQPYQRGYKSLLTLAELSKRDKHRAIHPTYLVDNGFIIKPKAVRDCEIIRVIHAPPGPFVDGRELARVQGRTTGPEPEIEGNAKLTGKVALSDGTFLQDLVDDMGAAVRRILNRFEPTLSGVLL